MSQETDAATEYVTSKDGTRIAYDVTGSGPSIILVTGALGTRFSWCKLPGMLSNQFAVVSYDRRGRGNSTDTRPCSLEREIDDIKTLIDEMAGGSSYLYGISSGGALALEAAFKLGGKVKKLAIYEVPYSTDDITRKRATEYQSELLKVLSSGDNGGAVELFMKLVGVPSEQIQGMRRAPMWKAFEALAPTLEYDSIALDEGFTLPKTRAKQISIPTIVMVGGSSPEFLRSAVEELKSAIPNSQLRTLEGQTHDVEPEALAPALKEFFR